VIGAVPGVNATMMVASQPKETTMERREIDAELNTLGALELLAATSAARLAYVGSDATPRVIPVGFWWTGEKFVIATAATSPEVAALSARPDVALAIDTGDSPGGARALSVRGRAEVEIVNRVVEEYLMAARKSMDTEAAVVFEESCRKMYPHMARIAITPSWVRIFDFGGGRMPRFLRDLADQAQS
jgi:hypothetical protein